MKKPFKNTKVGKLLTGNLVKGLLKSVPVVGDVAANVLDEVDGSAAGEVNKKELPVTILRIIILSVLLYLALSGKIGWADAEKGKDFITHSELVSGSNSQFSIVNSQL